MSDSESEKKVRKTNKKVKKTSDIKKYQKDYRENNKAKWMETVKCDICKTKHTIANTANHKRTWNHKTKELENEVARLKEELKQYQPDIVEDVKVDDDVTVSNSEDDE